MADKDVPNNAEAVEFLELIAAAVRVPTSDVRALAKKLGQPERYIYRWRNGEHGVSLRNALDMLKRSGVLELPELSERDLELFQMYQDGATMEEITARFAMSSLQVELVIADARRKLTLLASGGPSPEASETASLVGRLAALEAKVEAQGEATTKALRALAKDVRALGRQLAPAAPSTTRKRAAQ